jgi:hypothetical protein
MRDNAEADFREHRTITWEEVKTRNGFATYPAKMRAMCSRDAESN